MRKILFYIIALMSFIFSLDNSNSYLMQDEPYITGDDGVIRMYVNVIGHVKNPGLYLVYDNIDLMTMLSVSGGYLPGANLSNVQVYSKDGSSNKINLAQTLDSKLPISDLVSFKPHDTIHIKQRNLHKIFIASNLPSMILSFITLAITLEDKDGN
jgi:hypothetical protein